MCNFAHEIVMTIHHIKYIALSLVCLMFAGKAYADGRQSDPIDSTSCPHDNVMFALPADSAARAMAPDSVPIEHKSKWGFLQPVIDYFGKANTVNPDKAFDISFIGGPHYSSEEGFGIGAAGSGRYKAGKNWRNDSITPHSNITLKVDITTGQMYKIGVEGYHIFPGDRYRLNYDTYFYSFADKYWGIGYDINRCDSNETKYKRLQSQAKVDFVFKLRRGVFLGPSAMFSYIHARNIRPNSLLADEPIRTFTTGLGFSFMIDTRDIPTGATKGVYVKFDQIFNPRFLTNKYAFSMSEVTAATYIKVWKGGLIAPLLHGRFTYGNTPWGLMSTIGGNHFMRGYYEGRYRDKSVIDATVELRQHVWRRNGIAVWVGAGTVFPKFSAMRWRMVLPNAGIGYRWEFKKGVNVRLDIGFGRHEKGINFSLNEAF